MARKSWEKGSWKKVRKLRLNIFSLFLFPDLQKVRETITWCDYHMESWQRVEGVWSKIIFLISLLIYFFPLNFFSGSLFTKQQREFYFFFPYLSFALFLPTSFLSFTLYQSKHSLKGLLPVLTAHRTQLLSICA